MGLVSCISHISYRGIPTLFGYYYTHTEYYAVIQKGLNSTQI